MLNFVNELLFRRITQFLKEWEVLLVLCHLSITPMGNALFEPMLQCVSRYTATRLGLQLNIAADC